MASLFDHLIARLARLHARRVYAGFLRGLSHVDELQTSALRRSLRGMRGSRFSGERGLDRVQSLSDLRAALPLQTYEELRPYIDQVRDGNCTALFHGSNRPLMFATSSGTTAAQKFIPVTSEFVRQYRRGWNTFGLRLLEDYPRAILRAILQSSGRYDESYTSAGIPCGAITGLLARTQKRIVRRYYVGVPEIANINDATARYYTLARLGIARDVSWAVTANPATLIRIAQVASDHAESIVRDIRDGTLSNKLDVPSDVRAAILPLLRPSPQRATELDNAGKGAGAFRPRDYWKMEFAACWTGGSMAHYLPRLREWYGPIPVRDVGLLASEGRVSLPFQNESAAGVLDVEGACFEFLPLREADSAAPVVLGPRELEVGSDYIVVMTNDAGLVRYRLDDVVRVRGFLNQAPIVEFLHRAGKVSSVTGEKLTENQVVAAVAATAAEMGISLLDFVAAPQWGDPPYYRVSFSADEIPPQIDQLLDRNLCAQNDEYSSRRKSGRLGIPMCRAVPAARFFEMERKLIRSRGSALEQLKRPCLVTKIAGDAELLADARPS